MGFNSGFRGVRQIFPKISEAKMIKGISVGPQITQLLKDQDFNTKLNLAERRAWKAFEKSVCRNFLGNEKAENYSEIVHELVLSYSSLGCNMSYLHSHLDFLPENMGAIYSEHG